jgi:hypothetical protein
MNSSPEDKDSAIAACSCPATPDETIESPQCTVDELVQTAAPILFVKPKNGRVWCKHLVGFGHSHFCTCSPRMALYKDFGL